MFPIITPVYLPAHDPEEDKVECPKCHHRFIPEDDGCNGYCFLPFALFGLLLFVSCVVGALSILGLVNPGTWFNPADVGEFSFRYHDPFMVFMGVNALTLLLALPAAAIIHVFIDKR